MVLDLTGVTFLEPAGLAVLASAFDQAMRTGLIADGSVLLGPTNQNVCNYLRRMDLFHDVLAWDEPENFRRRTPQGFAPVSLFEDGVLASQAAADLAASVSSANSKEQSALREALTELAENVVFHAGHTRGAACAQGWAREVQLAIADRGDGIPSSLRRKAAHAGLSDKAALTAALERNVTRLDDPGRGQGLWTVSEMVEVNGGRLFVRSGSVLLRQIGHERKVSDNGPLWPGTVVVVLLKVGHPMSIPQRKLLSSHVEYDWVDL